MVRQNLRKSTEECINESDTSAQTELKKNSNETFMACVFLRNSDSLKCGSLKKNFQTQCTLNDNEYPRKIATMSDALGNHQWDLTHEEQQKKRADQRKESQQNNHNDKQEQENQSSAQLAQTNVICYCCGEKGHCASECKMRDQITKNDW